MTHYSSFSSAQLVHACAKSNDGAAWEEFVSRFRRAIALSISRTAYQWGEIPKEVVDDLVQETYLKLCSDKCRLLCEFASHNPEAVPGYIKTIAVNVAHDHFKAQYSQKRGAGRIQESLDAVDRIDSEVGLGSSGRLDQQILLKQLDQCLEACSAGPEQVRDRLIFWLYYRQGMSARSISELPNVGLTAKGVESAILRLTRLVRGKVVQIQSESRAAKERGEKGYRPAESY